MKLTIMVTLHLVHVFMKDNSNKKMGQGLLFKIEFYSNFRNVFKNNCSNIWRINYLMEYISHQNFLFHNILTAVRDRENI